MNCALCSADDLPHTETFACKGCEKLVHTGCFRDWIHALLVKRVVASKEGLAFMSAADAETIATCPFCRTPEPLTRHIGVTNGEVAGTTSFLQGRTFLYTSFSWRGHVVATSTYIQGRPDELVSIAAGTRHPFNAELIVHLGKTVKGPIYPHTGSARGGAPTKADGWQPVIQWSAGPPRPAAPLR